MSVNKVILVGNVGGEPDIRYFETDRAVANFSVATSERAYKNKEGNEIPERTEWHRVVAYGSTAKYVEGYVHRGSLVYVEGKIQTRTWTDKQNVERRTTEIIVDSMQILSRKSDNEAQAGAAPKSGPAPKPAPAPANDSQGEDDLPF